MATTGVFQLGLNANEDAMAMGPEAISILPGTQVELRVRMTGHKSIANVATSLNFFVAFRFSQKYNGNQQG